jgi:uncharacterized RmlC-like cupin family protein
MSTSSEQGTATCRVVRAGETFIGKQELSYAVGVSAESVGAKAINMQLVTIPPQARAKAHLHKNHESAIYVLSGQVIMWYGEQLGEELRVGPGDFLYIPAGVPHVPYNPSTIEPAVAVISRTDPNDQESVVLLPELDSLR